MTPLSPTLSEQYGIPVRAAITRANFALADLIGKLPADCPQLGAAVLGVPAETFATVKALPQSTLDSLCRTCIPMLILRIRNIGPYADFDSTGDEARFLDNLREATPLPQDPAPGRSFASVLGIPVFEAVTSANLALDELVQAFIEHSTVVGHSLLGVNAATFRIIANLPISYRLGLARKGLPLFSFRIGSHGAFEQIDQKNGDMDLLAAMMMTIWVPPVAVMSKKRPAKQEVA